jgi:hypothetical protein
MRKYFRTFYVSTYKLSYYIAADDMPLQCNESIRDWSFV